MSPIKNPPDPVENTFLLGTVIKDRPSIGIFVDDLSFSQFGLEALRHSAEFLEKSGKVEVCIFCPNLQLPAIRPPTAVYHTYDLLGYRGNMVVSTVDGLVDALRIKTIKKIIWYIYDIIEFSQYKEEQLKDLIKDPDIIKICRSPTYIPYIKSNYPEAVLEETPLPHLDLDKLSTYFFGRTKWPAKKHKAKAKR